MATLDLWTLVRKRPEIDPRDLAEAVRLQAQQSGLDYRMRLLIRDSIDALRGHWGSACFDAWLKACPERDWIEAICREEFEEVGFPSIKKRLMGKTDPDDIRRFLEELGRGVRRDLTIYIAGSIALILPGYISRHTEDINVVGEVPPEIRNNHQLLDSLEKRYGLHVGHVQTHYFPMRWQERAHSLGIFDGMLVFLVDVYDVFLSKLFSARLKDRDDLRVLTPQLDKDILAEKLKTDAASFLTAPRLLQLAQDNWKILYGEALPQ